MLRNILKLTGNLVIANQGRQLRYGAQLIRPSAFSVRAFSADVVEKWPDAIKNFLAQENISQPTPIQEKTLPAAMDNHDLVGVARTGSGKTLAFVIPAVMKILKERETNQLKASGERPATCLVLAPTRELASQIFAVFKNFSRLNINPISLVGGSSRSTQVRELDYKDHDVYIATPGRLQDLIDSNIVDLSGIKYLVLDEADRMLDMGFEPQIRKILRSIPQERQTLMWSATWPTEIRQLAKEFMRDYKYIAMEGEKLKANPNIKQIVNVCEFREKQKLLLDTLNEYSVNDDGQKKPLRTLIFVNMKRRADQLIVLLSRARHRAVAMHGDRSQRQRDDSLRLFREGRCNIMVATDVAARGLDIDDISLVINYDFPNSIEDYIHRIGRTARHDKKGTAVSFVTSENENIARNLVRILQETGQDVPDELLDMRESRSSHRSIFR